MLEELSPNQKGQPGYEGYLKQNVVTIATLLRDSGYKTYMTGKWHLGVDLHTSPFARGFERSFTALEIFCGSKGSKGLGLPVMTSQKAQALVHMSPIIKKVACLLLQHSVIFGQLASWQTVLRLY